MIRATAVNNKGGMVEFLTKRPGLSIPLSISLWTYDGTIREYIFSTNKKIKK